MNRNLKGLFITFSCAAVFPVLVFAQDAVAPKTPDLQLGEPVAAKAAAPAPAAPQAKSAVPAAPAAKKASAKKRRNTRKAKQAADVPPPTPIAAKAQKALKAQADVSVEEAVAPVALPTETPASVDAVEENTPSPDATAEVEFVAAREEVKEEVKEEKKPKVVYNPKKNIDPTLSPDDFLLLQYREQQRLAAIEAEKQRKLAEERRKREEAERLRQLELARIKDPTREVRNKIRIGGIIGQEVFIGSRVYTIGNRIFGAKIVEVRPDEVVFSYKGHKFVRKVNLKQ